MINLDDQSVYKTPPTLLSAITSISQFPQQLEQAWSESSVLQFPDNFKKAQRILVCGMGGSRFTPLAVKELFKQELKVPYVINDDYTIPGWVGPETLVILSSYSGTTEEVLACAEIAKTKKALVTGVTLGGPLANLLRQSDDKSPFYQFIPTHNPSNQPRIGVGYMVAGHIGIAYATGLLPIQASEVEKAITNMAKTLKLYNITVPKAENEAKKLAELIYQKYPYIITSEFLQGFGNCFANGLNETGKSISSPRVIPELNHHLMEGLTFPNTLKSIGLFLFFVSTLYDLRIQKRFAITKEVVEKNGLQTYWHEMKGKTKIEQLFAAIGFGSWVTMYLSVLYQQDPTAIPWVDYFKKQLAQ